jgi:hypothetical protein
MLFVGVTFLVVFAVVPALALAGNSATAKVCQKNGWQSTSLQTGSGASISFGSETACTSYGAQNGGVFNPTLTESPSSLVLSRVPGGGFESTTASFSGSGFHPNSTGVISFSARGLATEPLTVTTDSSGSLGQGVIFTYTECGRGVFTVTATFTDASGAHASAAPFTVDTACPS